MVVVLTKFVKVNDMLILIEVIYEYYCDNTKNYSKQWRVNNTLIGLSESYGCIQICPNLIS